MSRAPGSLRGARRCAVWSLVALLLAGCFFGGTSKTNADGDQSLESADLHPAAVASVRSGGTLTLSADEFPTSFNPWQVDGARSGAAKILAPASGSGVRVTGDGDWETDPDYVTSIEVTKTDPLTVSVELNPAAVWQDGTAITSADMVAFAKAMRGEAYAASAHPAFADVKSVKADGDFAYRVVFARPNADWPAVVYPGLPRSVASTAKTFNALMADTAVPSNGPFMVEDIDRATGTVTLVRNPRWWGRQPKLTSIVWRIADPEVLATAYLADELDAVDVTPEIEAEIADHGERRAAAGNQWSHLTLNGGRGPLADVKVRRAVQLAVDRAALAADTGTRYGVTTSVMDGVVYLPDQSGHRDRDVARDLDAARELLVEAGFEQSGELMVRDGEPLTLTLPVPETMASNLRRAELVKSDLAEVGITVQITTVPDDDYVSTVVVPLDFDLVTFLWRGSAFPLSAARQLFTPIDSSRNFTGKASKQTAAAFAAAVEELSAAGRADAVAELEQVVGQQASVVPLAVVPQVMMVDPQVVNFGPTTFADLDWTTVGFSEKDD